MMYDRYRVRSITWEQEERAAVPVAGIDAEDAVLEWCGHQDGNSNFNEGYPDGDVIEVMHPCGLRTRHVVHTDFTPSFHVYDKSESADAI